MDPITTGLPEWFDDNVNTHCLHIDGAIANIGHDTTVWRSEDGGETWSELVGGLPKITCISKGLTSPVPPIQ